MKKLLILTIAVIFLFGTPLALMAHTGKDDIEEYKIPQNLRKAISTQFQVSLAKVPKTYGDFIIMLKDKGVDFYINSGFLIVSKIGTPEKLLDKVSAKFFKPVTLKEMVQLRVSAKYYMAY